MWVLVGAARWGQVGFCRAGKRRAPIWAMAALPGSLQLGHAELLCLALAARPLSLLVGISVSLAGTAVDSLGSAGTLQPCGGLKQAVCVYLRVCVCVVCCVCKQWPCNAVPLPAKPCLDKAEQGQLPPVLGRNRPPRSSVTQLWQLCSGCSAQLCPMLGHRTGRWGTHRILRLPNLGPGTDPVSAMSAKLRRWQPHLCAHRPDTVLLGSPCPMQLCTGGFTAGLSAEQAGKQMAQQVGCVPALNDTACR